MHKILILIIIFFFGADGVSKPKCCEGNSNKAYEMLSKDFKPVISYTIDGRMGKRKKIEYSLVMENNVEYQIKIASKDGGSTGIIGTLYDWKRNILASSFVDKQFLDGVTYKCKAKGIYYLTFTFKKSERYCGGAALGIKE